MKKLQAPKRQEPANWGSTDEGFKKWKGPDQERQRRGRISRQYWSGLSSSKRDMARRGSQKQDGGKFIVTMWYNNTGHEFYMGLTTMSSR